MEIEKFTFVVCSDFGHTTEERYSSREDADKHFGELSEIAHRGTTVRFIAYYCASVGGLVNASIL
jgi:hypothetical protein